MKRQLLLAGGCVLLLVGWFSAFTIHAIPQPSDYYYLVPALLLGVGIGLVLKLLSAMRTAVVVALMAICSIVAVNQIYPSGKISLSGFVQKMEEQSVGQALIVEVQKADQKDTFAEERTLYSAADIRVQLFARLPGPVRMLAFDGSGHLYASIPKLGAIYRLTDRDDDGFAEQPVLFHADMDRPHGLLWQDDKLYVAETSRLLVLQDKDLDYQVDEVKVLLDNLPDDGGHWTRSLAMDKDGHLYLSIGSRCNACEEHDQRRATILRVDPQSGQSSVFAKGLRNTVGLAFAADGTLWGSDNGRDLLGGDLPPDEINRIVAAGDYGWPYCYGQQVPDPDLGSSVRCLETLASRVDLPAHSAPLGIAFGEQLQAPTAYRKSMYVAFHGSWNRSEPTGYKLVRIPFSSGEVDTAGREFLSGWLQNGKAWGRPVAPLVGPDGHLYLSDDRANAIYRISWNSQE